MLSERPAFTGLAVHRDLKYKFSLLYPEGWGTAPAPKSVGGTLLYPDATDLETTVLVQGRRLRTKVRPDDLDELRAGFEDGLRLLPEADVEHMDATAVGRLVSLEARHTFQEGAAKRKRWSRLLYQGSVQITVLAQGSSPTRFEYWLPMFTTLMRTVQFADWWADVTGTQWLERLDTEASATS